MGKEAEKSWDIHAIASVVKYLSRHSREGGNPEGWMPDESIRA
jgi:hypothetical protein